MRHFLYLLVYFLTLCTLTQLSIAQTNQCGDSILQIGEYCDDGGQVSGDGCSATCSIEWGYFACGGDASEACGGTCGDGIKITSEACDDGNSINGDGCSAECTIETPLSFECAMENDQKQRDAFPNYVSPRANRERSFSSERQPFSANFEPLLEQVPHCNGLPWIPNAVNRHLVEYQFIVVLDKSWIDYYDEYKDQFSTQGYDSLEESPKILFDRASYLYEAQFGVRVSISRVVVAPTLEEKCAETGGYVENNVTDNTHTPTALANLNVSKQPTEIGIARLGIDPPNTYCASYSGLAPWNNEYPLLVNTEHPFYSSGDLLRHRAAVTLAHELTHFFGIIFDQSHPHHVFGHIANEIPDIMVLDGRPIEQVRSDGMFFKFLTSCTPAYDQYLCSAIKATASSSIATPLICLGEQGCLKDTDADGSPNNCPQSFSECIADAFPGNPLYSMDSDSDGMPDSWEVKYSLDPMDPSDADSDRDNDGVGALDEFLAGTTPSGLLDLDGNGQYDALTDGLLLLRGMFGLSSDTLVSGVVSSDAAYSESRDIEERIETLGELADIDGNGNIDALTDGILTLRYLFGLEGSDLIDGVVANNSTRTTAQQIKAHLDTLAPSLEP